MVLKKHHKKVYNKLKIKIYSNFRQGIFDGVVVSKNSVEGYNKYELKLPTDNTFSKVHGDLILHYTVYKNQKIVVLNNITSDDILTEEHKKEVSTYKGVPLSKSHTEKDMFKINLLNQLDQR